MLMRSRALLAPDSAADELYRGAIEQLGRSRIVPQLGRAYLVYGEWLRRQHRRRDARSALYSACEILDSIGAEAFASRARAKLLATGERVRKRGAAAADITQLTPQELRVVGLASVGASKPRDSQPAVHQREYRRLPPSEGVQETRGRQPRRAGQRPRSR
jgi:hypothetical protein